MTRSYSASDASDAATATAATTGPLNCVRDAHAGISYETAISWDGPAGKLQSVDRRHGSHEAVTQINGKRSVSSRLERYRFLYRLIEFALRLNREVPHPH